MNGNEKKILLFGAISHALCHGYMLILPAVLLLVKGDFGTGLFEVGMVGNAAYFAFGLGALPAGYFADRFGGRGMVRTFLFGAALTAILLSASPTLPVLAGGFLLLGFFCSLYHPSGLSLVSKIRRRGHALAWHGVWGNLSIALAPVVFALLGSRFGWRGAYIIAGAAGLAVAVGALFIRFDPPHREVGEKRGALAEPGRTGRLALLYGMVALNGFVYRGMLTFLPAWLGSSTGDAAAGAVVRGGVVTSAALLLGIAGQLFGGKMYERFSHEKLLFVLLVSAVPFLFGTGRLAWPFLAFSAALFLFFHFAGQPVVNGLVAEYTRTARRSAGYGFSFFLSFGAGSFASSASGYVADRFGMGELFTFLTAFAAVLSVVAIVLIVKSADRSAAEGRSGEGEEYAT